MKISRLFQGGVLALVLSGATGTQAQVDLAIENFVATRPADVLWRSFATCRFAVRNFNPEWFVGTVVVEYFLSADDRFDVAADPRIGETIHDLSFAAWGTASFELGYNELMFMSAYWTEGLVPAGYYHLFARLVCVSATDVAPADNVARTADSFLYGAPADYYEPDNTYAKAKATTSGQLQNRSIHAKGNVDWVKFRVGGIGACDVRLETAGPSGDTQMWLYGPRSLRKLVAYDNNSGTGAFSRISRSSLKSGTYYVRIRENGNDGIIPAYTFRARWTTVQAGWDAYEPDNTRAAANSIFNGQTQERSLHQAGDEDWVKFTTSGLRNLRLETSGASGDTRMWLYDEDDIVVAYDDDGGTGGFSRIARAQLSAGTYWLRIQEKGNNAKIAAYRLGASWQ